METSSKIGKNVNTAFENLAFDVFWDITNKKVIADEDGSNGVKIGDLINTGEKDERSKELSESRILKKDKFDKKESGCCN